MWPLKYNTTPTTGTECYMLLDCGREGYWWFLCYKLQGNDWREPSVSIGHAAPVGDPVVTYFSPEQPRRVVGSLSLRISTVVIWELRYFYYGYPYLTNAVIYVLLFNLLPQTGSLRIISHVPKRLKRVNLLNKILV